MKLVEAYVDGGCSPNPGPGAFAAILDHKGFIKEFVRSGEGTNNQMEMRAALLALDALKERCEIHIYTDSQYLYNGMTRWFRFWRSNGWKNAEGKEVLNKNLWRQLDAASRKHIVHWHWIRGHVGHPMNQRADDLVHKEMGLAHAPRMSFGNATKKEENRRRSQYRRTLQGDKP